MSWRRLVYLAVNVGLFVAMLALGIPLPVAAATICWAMLVGLWMARRA